MKKLSAGCLLALGLMVGFSATSYAVESFQTPTGVLRWDKEKAFDGYTLVSPNTGTSSYLLDMEGNIVHEWKTKFRPGLYAELLPNGNILRGFRDKSPVPFGGAGTGIQEIDWNGNVVWEYVAPENHCQHHCFKRLPNGNTLVLMWEYKTAEEAYEKGRAKGTLPAKANPKTYDGMNYDGVWPDMIVEVDPQGKEVWEWHVWDHVGTGVDQINLNYILPTKDYYNDSDWTHFNSIDYIPETNQLVLCSRNFGEIFLVNKDNGKIEYRFGNPSTHGKGMAPTWINENDQQLFGPHNATWIGNNRIMIFDNGWQNPERNRSRIAVLDIKQNKIVWEYTAANLNSFFSAYQGAAQKLPNGNILVTSSNTGHGFEVTMTDKPEIVWEFVNPWVKGVPTALLTDADGIHAEINLMFNYTHRMYRYGKDFAGFEGKTFSEPKALFPNAPKWRELFEQARAMKAE